jgi:hypothetical protein
MQDPEARGAPGGFFGDLHPAGFRRPIVVAGEIALDYAWRQPFIIVLDAELDLCLDAGLSSAAGRG